MRYKAYSVIYLVILLFYMIRPALPYIEYSLFKDYIAKNLCINKDIPENSCHGKCFLDEQVKKNSEPLDNEKDNKTKFIQDKKVEDHLKGEEIISKPSVAEVLVISFYSISYFDSFQPSIFIPPRS